MLAESPTPLAQVDSEVEPLMVEQMLNNNQAQTEATTKAAVMAKSRQQRAFEKHEAGLAYF